MPLARRRTRWLWIVGIAALVLAAGPRTSVRSPDPTPIMAGVPEHLESLRTWVMRRELDAGVADTAVAKRVRFFNESAPRRTPWSVVYLHGFSATRQETAPVAERVADSLGANLFETRLTGHGLPGDSLSHIEAGQWLGDVVEAMTIGRRLGDSVLVIGTSTGGTLAIWLATQPDDVRAGLRRLVLISPNLGPADRRAKWITWPWLNVLVPQLSPVREWSPANEEQRRFWTVRYPTAALVPMQALVEHVRAMDWRRYAVPTLLLVNEQDDVVDTRQTDAWMSAISTVGSATVERVPIYPIDGESGHVLAGRIVSPSQTPGVVQRIGQFVRP